ncbi:unnamed protein product, partial [Meganyctiphanes norvegica]
HTFSFDRMEMEVDPSLALPHQVVMFIPLLSVLPHCVQDVVLCHNTLAVMLELLTKNSDLQVPLIQRAHLVDSLLLTLKKALHTDSCGVSDVSGESECQIILADITEILSCLTNALVASTQHKFFMVILEILQQLSLVSRSEAVVCGGQASCVGHLRVMEAHLLQVALSRIQVSAATSSHTLTHQ